jgi:hypothetical protein
LACEPTPRFGNASNLSVTFPLRGGTIMKHLIFVFLIVGALTGCGLVEDAIRRNDDRLLQPGALDAPLSKYYDIFTTPFLGKYRITHHWPVFSGGCNYRGKATLNHRGYEGVRFRQIYDSPPIYEDGGKYWQRFPDYYKPLDVSRLFISQKRQYPIYLPPTKEEIAASNKKMWERIERQRKSGRFEPEPPDTRTPIGYEEREEGFRRMCFDNRWVASTYFEARIHKRDVATWQALLTTENPKGIWSTRSVSLNTWTVQEVAEQDFSPPRPNGVGGPYQFWLLPIGDSGHTIALEFGANQVSLKYPAFLEELKAIFKHLVKSVKIEPLTP